ncbi:chitin-inducible gibberellin-responsive protein 1-like [Curcuma longa]|uniref:chitin-inducible gibberellin-responsive protein 1-like n=1 Tax=Curcuma longa TaxID=136217 RepID=UPI003D9ED6C6
MDFRRLYGLYNADISCELPSPRNIVCTEWTFDPVKVALDNALDSPLSCQFECNNFSRPTNSHDLWFDSISAFEQELSLDHLQEGKMVTSDSLYVASHQSIKHALQEIEMVLMAPDSDEPIYETNENKQPQLIKQWFLTGEIQPDQHLSAIANSDHELRPEKRLRGMSKQSDGYVELLLNKEPKSDVKQLLIKCAEALSENKMDTFESLVGEAQSLVSIGGEPIQRLGVYVLEGLVARQKVFGSNIYQTLQCHQPTSKELLSYMHIMYDVCPYFKYGYMAANGAIADALKNENKIHIIDFQIAQGTQWITLIQALAVRPGGPPHVRITGINDPESRHAHGDGLQLVGKMLSNMSRKFNIPLEFKWFAAHSSVVLTKEMLDIRPGEALAVNFTLQLHHTPDEGVDVSNPRDELLRMVKGLSPKVTTLVEQESNTNTTPFLTRFIETLDYYSAMLESIDVALPRDSKERINLEKHCLAKDIVNIIACEGKERVERHELLGKWRSRFTMAGFQPYPLSPYVNSVIKTLLGYYSGNYTLVERDGAMLLGWKNRNLISASAWH